jgi:tripartite-type tricarboxylate transporter receptor subunit TctC
MLTDMLNALAGAPVSPVPYARIADAIQDTLAGRTQIICLSSAALMPLITAGRLQPLAVSTARRLPSLPEVPALAETFPGFDYSGWHALFARAGTSAALVQRVNRDLDRALRDPEVSERLATLALINEGAGSIQVTEDFLRAERKRWAAIVERIGLKPE